MKKRFWTSLAICSLGVLVACGEAADVAKEAAREPTVAQQSTTPEPKEEVAVEEVSEPEAEPAAVTEAELPSEPNSELGLHRVLTPEDQELLRQYNRDLNPVTEAAKSAKKLLEETVEYAKAGDNEAIMQRYKLAEQYFEVALQASDQVEVPLFESEELQGLVNQWNDWALYQIVYGKEAMTLSIEGYYTGDADTRADADIATGEYIKGVSQVDLAIDQVLTFINEAE